MQFKKSVYKNYENYFIVFIIILALVLLFIFTYIPEKKISELKYYSNGRYIISGYVSQLKISENYTNFKLNDSTDSISIIAFHKINDLNNGLQNRIICNLQTTQYGKVCYINNN